MFLSKLSDSSYFCLVPGGWVDISELSREKDDLVSWSYFAGGSDRRLISEDSCLSI